MEFIGGLPETRCGGGSTLAHTEAVRAELPMMLVALGVWSLVDAPCGDFNWLSRTDLSRIDYIGVDVDPGHIAAATARRSDPPGYRPRSKMLMRRDIVSERVPEADAVLCRDFLQHLPTALARIVIAQFVAAGGLWLIATSHGNAVNDDIAVAGDFRPLNLQAAPFDFPPPVTSIADGANRILGAWAMAQLA